jgi:MtrB/PioB family decaheme-associated outer membrane protein
VVLLPLLAAFAFCAAPACAEDDVSAGADPVDTSKWTCEFCPFEEEGTHGSMEGGVGYISDDSFRFGDDSGLDEEGLFAVAGGEIRHRGADGLYFDLEAADLGLDSRSLLLEGGQQGRYSLYLGYRELPKLRYDTAVTPFRGEGSGNLTLPPGWTTAGTTGGMTDLAASLHDVDIEQERRWVDIGGAFIASPRWEYGVNYRHEKRSGIDSIGGTFLVQSAILPEPVDYITDLLDVTASYSGRDWQAQLAYYGSMFRNADESLTWQNPYTPLAPGADRGRLALAPDNQSHQIMLSGAFSPLAKTHVSASLAVGRMEQDEDFIPATINPNLSTPLPRESAEAEVDTLTATIRGYYVATSRLKLNAEYLYNDRDNKTPRDSFTQVQTDTFVAAARTNLPYSYTDNTLKLGADYRVNGRTSFAFGFDHDRRRRDLQERDRTEEDRLWGRLRLRPRQNVEVTAKLGFAQRDGSGFEPVAEVQPPENPRHRAFHLADRERSSAGLRSALTPREGMSLGLGADYTDDDFDDTDVGLTEARNLSLTADASALLRENLVLNGFFSRSNIRSEQAGSQAFAGPDWTATNRDMIHSVGMGVDRKNLMPKLDVSAQYVYSKADGRVQVDSGAGEPAFPDLETKLHSLRLSGNYHWRPQVDLRLGYRYERYADEDWQLDDVAPATIPNVLSLGQGSPDYRIHLLTLSAAYHF